MLRQLPRGRWIAGTIPYFMTEEGGVCDRERIYVERTEPRLEHVAVRRYGAHDVSRVYADLPAGSVAIVIVPWGSGTLAEFAVNAPSYEQFACAPLFGWVAGVHLDDRPKRIPLVFDGSSAEPLDDAAVVLQARLQPGYAAELAILNIFEPGNGPVVTFPETGFSATTAEVEGRRVNFAEWVRESALDTRLPLVADYAGASINVSFQHVDDAKREVVFFAPVFADVPYRHARPVGDYVRAFTSALPRGVGNAIALSCNCVLNYVHSSLEGRSTGGIAGPITFGEIAYQLLNQTMVYLTVSRAR